MSTVSIKLRASAYTEKEGTLYYQVTHRRVTRKIRSTYKLYPWEWDAESMTVVCPPTVDTKRRAHLTLVDKGLHADTRRLADIFRRFETSKTPYTVDDLTEAFRQPADGTSLSAFVDALAKQLRSVGKDRMAAIYIDALNSFMKFRGGRDVSFDEIDADMIMAYGVHLSLAGIGMNTVSFYMRALRAIYNRAVDKKLTVQRDPFKHAYTGIDKTPKRAIPIEAIRAIRDLDLSRHPALAYARDLFLFSFYTCGMSFVDIAFLKKSDLQDNQLVYHRHKTQQRICIKWEQPMQDIVDKYNVPSSPFLLPIIQVVGCNEHKQYLHCMRNVNRNLKKIGQILKLSVRLTTYVARHSWADTAKSQNVPISIISRAMGHTSEATTRIYLASLDTTAVAQANERILKAL